MPPQHRPFANHPCAAHHPHLIQNAQLALAAAIGQSTRQSYLSGVKSYIRFVDNMGITPAFPGSLETLCLWITAIAFAPQYLKVGTCKVYLSGVIHHHIERGFNNPIESAPPMLNMIFTGIKRLQAYHQAGNQSKPKLPITTNMLRIMTQPLNPNMRSDALILAMTWVALTAMLRISEFTVDTRNQDRTLTMNQLSFTTHNNHIIDSTSTISETQIKHATLHLNQSKTDPFRKGMDIIIAAPEAIRAIINYLAQTTDTHTTSNTPLFRKRDGSAVTRTWFMNQVATLVESAGYKMSQYSSHSFRKGGAVSLQQRGVEDSVIRNMGRWRSGAYHLYLRYPDNSTIIQASHSI